VNSLVFNVLRLAVALPRKGEETEERESMLRVQRSTEGNDMIFALSGRIEVEDVAELQRLFQSEPKDHNLVLDLKDVRLVNRDAVRFLADCEADGVRLKNCPAYIREWIARERDGSNRHQG
jgi:hypothetical protein